MTLMVAEYDFFSTPQVPLATATLDTALFSALWRRPCVEAADMLSVVRRTEPVVPYLGRF